MFMLMFELYSDIQIFKKTKRSHETNKYRKSAKLFFLAMYADLCSIFLHMHFIVIYCAVISFISHQFVVALQLFTYIGVPGGLDNYFSSSSLGKCLGNTGSAMHFS